MKRLCIILGSLLCIMLLSGCGKNPSASEPKELTLDERTDKIVAAMSQNEKIGQLVMMGIHGTEITDDSRYMLHQYHIGGVILFSRNIESIGQVQKLTADLQREAKEKVPLLIAIDEEGGRVSRISGIMEPAPGERAIADEGNPELAREWAVKTAQNLKQLGINTNFAPVVDVSGENAIDSTIERSYGDDGEVVAAFASEAAQGYESENTLYTLKHFPGLGRGTVDSHQAISSVEATAEELAAVDLVPFRTIIEQHPPENFLIMVAHLNYPAYDDANPASLSPAIIGGLLREQLGFKGIVITDDLGMGAVAEGDFGTRAVRAVKAGADIVLVCHEYESEQAAYLALLDAVEKGEISQERLDESVRRIVKTKLAHLEAGQK